MKEEERVEFTMNIRYLRANLAGVGVEIYKIGALFQGVR